MRVVSFFGIFMLVFIAYILSENRKAINWRAVIFGCLLQLILGVLVLGIPHFGFSGPLQPLFSWGNDAFTALMKYTKVGSEFLFSPFLLDPKKSSFVFALQVLPPIIVFSALISIFYYLGILQKFVKVMALVMQKTMGTSGAESLSAAANIFVGQSEAPLLIRPYLKDMTRSELMAIMSGGMATVAGGMMAAYVGLLIDRIPDIAGHLITASVMSAPASLVIAKILVPETKTPKTHGKSVVEFTSRDSNVLEATANGATEGWNLAMNVAAMLLVFIALVAMINGLIGAVGEWSQFSSWGADLVPQMLLKDGKAQLSLQLILGWMFAPFALIMGIPWSEAITAGGLLGEKVVLNEFIAYLNLSDISAQLSKRTTVILSYALCGFANFTSIAIQIGSIGSLATNRKADVAKLGIRALIGGSLAAFMTASIAGFLL